MKKSEAQEAFPSLLDAWIIETKQDRGQIGNASFSAFYAWLADKYPHYKKFRSTMGADYDFEGWFDEATGQVWKR